MSFPPVPSTEITKDGKNLSPAWIAFFSQVFSNGGISSAAVNSGTPTFSGNVTVTNLTVNGTASVAGAARFSSPVAFSSSAAFAGDATFSGTFQASAASSFNGATNFNSSAQFNSAATFSAAGSVSFLNGFTSTSATIADLTFNTDTISSANTLEFKTTPSGGSATTALTIDNSRVFTTNLIDVSGPIPDPSYATCMLGGNFFYTDTVSAASATNLYGISYNFYPVAISATNTAVTYSNGITFFIGGGMASGVNTTVTNSWALWTDAGSTNLSNAFYASDGFSDSKSFTGALCIAGVFGYGTHPVPGFPSPGGAVTQGTSKSNGVSLSRACGAITMNAAALAAGASVEFVLTNSYIAATDTVICNMGPGGTVSTYLVQCQAVAAGSCRFRVTNYSATNRSEACVVNFSIIKAVNA